MAFTINERLKHRLVGIIVIISIGTIFIPALMKTSSSKIEQTTSIAIQLPPKPALPDVTMKNKEELFKTVKVAHVTIPTVSEPLTLKQVAKAESLTQMNEATRLPVSKSVIAQAKLPRTKNVSSLKVSPVKETLKLTATKEAAKKIIPQKNIIAKSKPFNSTNYAVQLATFSIQNNAITLVNKLKSKGYKATVNKSIVKNNVMYKVLVGNASEKQQALLLKQQLAATMQLTGFIVSTGIS